MTDEPESVNRTELLLTELEEYESESDGESDQPVWYTIKYLKKSGETEEEGKLIEFGSISSTSHADLATLSSEDFTHFGIFRVKDRSTTTIAQSKTDGLFKIFSFSRSDVKVSHPVVIHPPREDN